MFIHYVILTINSPEGTNGSERDTIAKGANMNRSKSLLYLPEIFNVMLTLNIFDPGVSVSDFSHQDCDERDLRMQALLEKLSFSDTVCSLFTLSHLFFACSFRQLHDASHSPPEGL